MKTFYTIIFLLFLAVISNSCKKPGCFGTAGKMIVKTHALPHFDEIFLKDNIDLSLVQAANETIEITAPENIQPNIVFSVNNNILTISNNTGCEWLRTTNEKITAQLSFVTLKKILYKGIGTISNVDTLKLNNLQIESPIGAGTIELTINNHNTAAYIFGESATMILHGKTEACFTYTSARGQMKLSDLVAKKMTISYGGLADTHINVLDELDLTIYHKGHVLLKGNPLVKAYKQHSSGKLIYE